MIDEDAGRLPRDEPVLRTGCSKIEHWRDEEPLKFADRDDAIVAAVRHPAAVADRARREAARRHDRDDRRRPASDVGGPVLALQQRRAHWFTRGGLGAMGFGLPAAMGAQAAHPLKTVIDIDGDGSFLMNIQELATRLHREVAGQGAAAQQPAPGHGDAVGRPLPRRQPRPHLPRRRLRARAVSRLRDDRQGLQVRRRERSSKKGDLDDALEEMLDSKVPYVLDVLTPYQEHVLPMIPGGMTVRDIIKA